MSTLSVVGLQWGDEGKGRIVDLLSQNFDIVVRFQGGDNAGHTIVLNKSKYKLSLIPSGILHNNKISVIGNGCVINPDSLLSEIENLCNQSVPVSPSNLIISDICPLILPHHKLIDSFLEDNADNTKIGTTGKGIGPSYADKALRRSIRICDLEYDEIMKTRIKELCNFYNPFLSSSGLPIINETKIFNYLCSIRDKILLYTRPVWKFLQDCTKQNKNILFEGAQGVMLDLDHGTYPFVTSSNTLSPNLQIGCGFPIKNNHHSLGIIKAYTTRVGMGPFPTELKEGKLNNHLLMKGNEFGTVTGRARRCGWLDMVALKQYIYLSGVNSLCLTKLDILSGLDELKICHKYSYDNKELDYLPSSEQLQKSVSPHYITLSGWQEDISSCKSFADLPQNAKNYIHKIEEILEQKIVMVSTGPDRESCIYLSDNSMFNL